MKKLRIVVIAAECTGLAEVGGIAPVALSYSLALIRQGHDVRVVIPRYCFINTGDPASPVVPLPVVMDYGIRYDGSFQRVFVSGSCAAKPLPVYLVASHPQFTATASSAEVYSKTAPERWVAFCVAVANLLSTDEWCAGAQVVHCNDAHSAMLPVYMSVARSRAPDSGLARMRSVLTIHNLLDPLLFEDGPHLVGYAGPDASDFVGLAFEYWGKANVFKAGMMAADVVSTVSRTYAQEISEAKDFEYTFGMSGVLRDLAAKARLFGVVNGIDLDRWSLPGFDYQAEDPSAALAHVKRVAREALFAAWNWTADGAPIIAFRGRWDLAQKGIDLLVGCAPGLMQRARLVVCAWGATPKVAEGYRLWQELQGLAEAAPDRLLVNPVGVATVEQTPEHYLVSDFILVPSHYEPCGLVQLEAMRHGGAWPVVSRTGGLADTVIEGETGFLFSPRRADELMAAVDRALAAFDEPVARRRLQRNVLRQSEHTAWSFRVPEYEALYRAALAR